MGARNGVPLPRYSCCIRPQNPDKCRENHHARIVTKRKSHRRKYPSSVQSMRSLSADFDLDASVYGLLDINTTTAEELMTLPGINRSTATNIVAYRRQIGGFRKIEDLALVPGVGATRFGRVRAEICVRDNHDGSSTSSGIDVSVNMADNTSGDVTNASELRAATTVSERYPPVDDLSDRVSGTGNSIDDESFDDVTTSLLNRSVLRTTSTPELDCGLICNRQDSGTRSLPLRVATWNLEARGATEGTEDAGRGNFFKMLVQNWY